MVDIAKTFKIVSWIFWKLSLEYLVLYLKLSQKRP